MLIADAHCDTILHLAMGKSLKHNPSGQLDLERMEKGRIALQFFAVFVEDQYVYNGKSLKRSLSCIEAFYKELNNNKHMLFQILEKKDLKRIGQGKLAALLTLEGGECLEGSLEILSFLYRIGVRSMGLTWNRRNNIADGISEARTTGGLTNFGVNVVQEMNRLGMLIDAAHLSETGFWDVIDTTSRPIIVSHANCKNLYDHPRNLSDEQINALAENGGVMGVTFVSDFLGLNADVETAVNHVDHVCQLLGTSKHIGFGSDFDGTDNLAKGLENAGHYYQLIESLSKRGYRKEDIERIAGKNILRILYDVF